MSKTKNAIQSAWLNPKTTKPESDVEYFVITEDECFYTAFFEPLGFKGWRDIASDQQLNVLLYAELPDPAEIIRAHL
mgnify:CR=1 FL=1